MRLKVDLTGKDKVFLSNVNRYYNGLAALTLFRTRQDQLEMMKAGIMEYEHRCQTSANGDRAEIIKRKAARKVVEDLFKKALHYLQAEATEEHLPELLEAGIEACRSTSHKKAVVAPT